MTYKLRIERKRSYVHVTVTGRNTRENVVNYLHDVCHECETHHCPRLLIEERLHGPRLDSEAVFDIADNKNQAVHGTYEKIAYVDVFADRSAKPARGKRKVPPVSIFPSVADAINWLRETTPQSGTNVNHGKLASLHR